VTHDYNCWVCVDCYFAHHYGADSVEYADWGKQAYLDMANSFRSGAVTDDTDAETGDGYREFSKAQCDFCDSLLAGNRFRLAVTL